MRTCYAVTPAPRAHRRLSLLAAAAAFALLFGMQDAMANSRRPPATRPPSPDVAQRAREIERRTGVTNHRVQTDEGRRWLRYDLSGRGHRDRDGAKVQTPHVVEERTNINRDPSGQVHTNRPRQGEVRPMTHSDIRVLERALRERQER